MFQPTQQRISEKIKSTLDSDALPFHETLDANMVESAMASESVQFKDRIYTPFVTLCISSLRCSTRITRVAQQSCG